MLTEEQENGFIGLQTTEPGVTYAQWNLKAGVRSYTYNVQLFPSPHEEDYPFQEYNEPDYS